MNSSSVVPKSLSNQIIATAAEIEQLYKSELSARYIDYSKDQSGTSCLNPSAKKNQAAKRGSTYQEAISVMQGNTEQGLPE